MNAATGHETAFTDYLATLARQEIRAALAALRRGIGTSPDGVVEMLPYVMPFIGEHMPTRRQDDYFLVASLFAAHPLIWSPARDQRELTNLGASFRRLRAAFESGSIEKRFVALLNAEREDLPDHLRHPASLLKAPEIPLHCQRLLRALACPDSAPPTAHRTS